MRRLLLLVLLLAGTAQAKLFLVAPTDDLQTVVDQAEPGDIVRLKPGVHRQRVAIQSGGTYGAPLTIEGEPGAILDGSEPAELHWTPLPEVGPGVWHTAVPFVPQTVLADGKIVTLLQERRVRPDNQDEAWRWPKLFREGVGKSGFEGVEALAMYRLNEGDLLCRFKGDRDPRQMTFTLAPVSAACVRIDGADRVRIAHLTLRNAWFGVFITESLGTVIEDCVIGPVDHGVWLASGSLDCTVRFCDLFMDPYSGASPFLEGSWDNWLAHKTGGFYDRYGVQIRNTLGGHQIHDNYLHDTWDGIEDVGTVGENQGLNIHHNRLETISDDGLEPNGAEEDCAWHDNLVSGCICGFRIKAPRRGPLYAYRNIFFHNKEDYRNYGERKLDPAEVYVYHNTSTSSMAIQSNKVFGIGTPRYHYFNNLFLCNFWWANAGQSVQPNWQGEHNVYVRQTESNRWQAGIDLAKSLGLDQHSRWVTDAVAVADLAQRDVSLTADSPARGAGADLTALLGHDLPGLTPGEHPDAGALPFGTPMPTLPRPRGEVDCPSAGTWPPAEVHRPQPWTGDNLLTNGGFEQGLEGWSGAAESNPQAVATAAAAGQLGLRYDGADGQPTLRRKLEGLTVGAKYALVYRSRRSTFGDFRVILRDLGNAAYLTRGDVTPGDRWRRTVLYFTAPTGGVQLELSPRTAGRCELDEIGVYAAP